MYRTMCRCCYHISFCFVSSFYLLVLLGVLWKYKLVCFVKPLSPGIAIVANLFVIMNALLETGTDSLHTSFCVKIIIAVLMCACCTIQENETAIEFAQRVKANICHHGGLVDLPW